MKPIEFDGCNVTYGKDQPDYNPLPAHKDKDGTVTTCWELSPEDLEEINKTGKIFLSQMTFNKPLQPIILYTGLVVLDMEDFKDDKGE